MGTIALRALDVLFFAVLALAVIVGVLLVTGHVHLLTHLFSQGHVVKSAGGYSRRR